MTKTKKPVLDLDYWLDDVQVGSVDDDISEINGLPESMADWHHVSTGEKSIIAYFQNETDACRFRLDYINRKLNP